MSTFLSAFVVKLICNEVSSCIAKENTKLNVSYIKLHFIQLLTSSIIFDQPLYIIQTWTLHSPVWCLRNCPSPLWDVSLHMYLLCCILRINGLITWICDQRLRGYFKSTLHLCFLKDPKCKVYYGVILGETSIYYRFIRLSMTFIIILKDYFRQHQIACVTSGCVMSLHAKTWVLTCERYLGTDTKNRRLHCLCTWLCVWTNTQRIILLFNLK